MPITQGQREAFATRLESAYTHTRELNDTRPWVRELAWDYGLGQEWPIVTAAYSGIEQTLKFLIALQETKSVEELIETPMYRTHRLPLPLRAARRRA